MEKVRASFRLVGDNLDPDRVTDLMGINPTDAKAKGASPPGHPEIRYPTGVWRKVSPISHLEPLEAHLNALLDLLEPRVASVRQLQAEGCEAEFFCGLFYTSFNGAIELDPPTLSRLGQFGAALTISTYDMHEDHEPEDELPQG